MSENFQKMSIKLEIYIENIQHKYTFNVKKK